MYAFLTVIHVFVCLVLIAVILLQAGRGGGMSEMMGGGQPQSIFGTQTNKFMTRATEVCAIVFIVTSLALGIISTHKGKSLMEKKRLVGALKSTLPAAPMPDAVNAATIPQETASDTVTAPAVTTEAANAAQETNSP